MNCPRCGEPMQACDSDFGAYRCGDCTTRYGYILAAQRRARDQARDRIRDAVVRAAEVQQHQRKDG